MAHSFSIPLPQTSFARATFTRESVESLAKAAWAIILARYAGSDIVTLQQVQPINLKTMPDHVHHLELPSSKSLGSLLKQIKKCSISSLQPETWQNHGTTRSKIYAAGGSIADDASHVFLVVKDDSSDMTRGKEMANHRKHGHDGYDTKLITCTLTIDPSTTTGHLENLQANPRHLQRIASHFNSVFRSIIAHSHDKSESALQTPLGKCFYVSHNEIDEIISWNQAASTPAPHNHYGPIHHIIKQHATRHQDAPAICAWDGEFTYSQLWNESSKLAERLMRSGVTLESMVPFCFEKSAWAIIAMLGILKAGGAFVPLDPSWPRSRLEYVIVKTQAKLIVTSTQMTCTCAGLVDHILVFDSSNDMETTHSDTMQPIEVGPNNLAYVLFTSGTTGQPKGVLIEHEQFSTSVIAIGKFAHMDDKTRIFQFASYGFDAIFIETMSALTLGGCICVPPDSERLDDPVHAIRRMHVNTIFFTPSFLSAIESEPLVKTTKVHTVITGGEILPVPLMEDWRRDFHFVNAYGPTECCIATVMSNVTASTPAQGRIGRAISGKTWIVDPENDDVLAPIGGVGELLLQGPAVGRGYLDNPKKTAESFTDISCFSWAQESLRPSAHGNHSQQERIYRTGDLVRYNAEGELFYVGRKDTQVKLRGQRIELGEIEFHLRKHITSPLQVIAEIVTKQGTDGETQVIAALIWSTTDSTTVDRKSLEYLEPFLAELDQQLKESLPGYMVPSVYMPVPNIPLTTSGKLDRRTLRAFTQSSHAKPFQITKPHPLLPPPANVELSEMELDLRKLWARFLNIADPKTITPSNHFLYLGGNSILAIKMVAAARKQHISLRVQDIFNHPTLAAMATIASRLDNESERMESGEPTAFSLLEDDAQRERLITQATEQCKVRTHLIQDILPCTPAQIFYMDSTTYFADSKERGPIRLSDHFIFRVRPDVDIFNLRAAWDQVAFTHEILRTRLILGTDEPQKTYQVVIREGEANPLTWRHLFDVDLEVYLAEDKKQGFGYGDRLCRFAFVTTSGNMSATDGSRETYFALSIQHSICDAWMMSLLFDQVEKVYNKIHSIPLGYTQNPESIKFNSFLKHMVKMNNNIEAAAKFWRDHLKDAICKPFPSPPENRSLIPPSEQSLNSILTHTIQLPSAPNDNGPGHGHGITLSTAIYGALALLMGIYTQAPDVIFHLTRSGRDIALPGVEPMIAPTLTRHPLRVHIGGMGEPDQTVGDFLNTIQSDLSNMVEYQFTGWSEIQRLVQGAEGVLGCRSSYLVNVIPNDDESDTVTDQDGNISKSPNEHGDSQTERRGNILEVESEATFTPMPAGFYTSFVMASDGCKIDATARYDRRVFKQGGVEGLLRGLEALLGRVVSGVRNNTGDKLGGDSGETGVGEGDAGEGAVGGGFTERLDDIKRWMVGSGGLALPSDDELYL